MKDLSKKIVEAEFLPLDPYRATKEDVLSEDTFRYLNAIENEFFKESILFIGFAHRLRCVVITI